VIGWFDVAKKNKRFEVKKIFTHKKKAKTVQKVRF
jgi:hypothetical protein